MFVRKDKIRSVKSLISNQLNFPLMKPVRTPSLPLALDLPLVGLDYWFLL